MDARTYLALVTKVKLVFESADAFMSFPALSPITYTADQLNFGAFGSPSPSERLVYSEFSRVVNSIPSGTIFDAQGQFLWEIYESILRTAHLAKAPISGADAGAYQRALTTLSVADSNGIMVPSPMFLAYMRFRDAWFQAVQNYKAQQLTAASSTDAGATTRWETVDEPQLKTCVDQAETAWLQEGFKNEIENAQQVKDSFEANSPQQTWQTWASAYDPDIVLMTDPNQQTFAPTSFMPTDAFDEQWMTFRILDTELEQLLQKAPQELKDIFAAQADDTPVKEISFDYRSVSLTRAWFEPELLQARFWRLPDGAVALSDGESPPNGTLPAYITALVLVRNIQVISSISSAPASVHPLQTLPAFRFQMPSEIKTINQLAVPSKNPGGAGAILTPSAHPIQPNAASNTPIKPQIANASPAQRLLPRAVLVTQSLKPETAAPPSPNEAASGPAQTQGTQNASATASVQDISILAFICKRTPKSPNPDPSLNWTS